MRAAPQRGSVCAQAAGRGGTRLTCSCAWRAWRRTSSHNRPRGLFCGIGVCFDCLITVNGARDVRACQRRATDGDVVETQHDRLPAVRE